MSLLKQIVFVFTLLITATWAHSQTKESTINKLVRFLDAQEVSGTINENGEIEFDYEDNHYFITFDNNDPRYIHLYIPNYWPLETDDEFRSAYYACNDASKEIFGPKAYIKDDHIWVSYEVYLENSDDIQHFLKKCLGNMKLAIDTIYDSM